ncbi:glutamine--fructose-6-phosphate aminotransferase [Candidatus Termititenax spirochaetophilus]|uniref:Glutamine--fructose-6-phosphate aminotransferase [isomerizing] n=1 Tax=Candidatus Termititenax spirochaetophilus TaxID=2218522 RepID=A0A388T8L4_9BACT|nr:glutamine--fructose-6-phosphate aminotransferase [Candidatus Termititenax spirochaetophilus]
MCGIVGYLGKKEALPLVIDGLKYLEYRGYDSAGVAVHSGKKIEIVKAVGKINDLEQKLEQASGKGTCAIGHTRWATHGKPCLKNSHPHQNTDGNIVLVHNGIIENYGGLKIKLEEEGVVFKSETDTEVLVQLIGRYYDGDLAKAVIAALREVTGTYAIAVLAKDRPNEIVIAKKSAPLCIGIGKGENFFGSDAIAFIKHTNKVVYLKDGEVAVLTPKTVLIKNLQGKKVSYKVNNLSLDPSSIEKGEYPHFMLKEIYEQPRAIQDTLDGRISPQNDEVILTELDKYQEYLLGINKILIVACGTSWHAGLVAEYILEKHARIPVEVDYAAEFRYRFPVLDEKTLVLTISQSGETADTIAAIGEAQALGAKVLSIVNVPASTIARDSDMVIYTYAGREIGVASTKAFTTQLIVLSLFAVYLGRLHHSLDDAAASAILQNLKRVPNEIAKVFNEAKNIKKIAKAFHKHSNALYLGRGVGFPIALEGALKLKEISYIHAEGYPAAEMKHGPIALIDENMPTVVLAFKGRRYEKILGNIMEVKARKGKLIVIASESNDGIKRIADWVIHIPDASESISAILAVVPLQLLAYYIAVEKGCSVDQPRNLAKSVTVE